MTGSIRNLIFFLFQSKQIFDWPFWLTRIPIFLFECNAFLFTFHLFYDRTHSMWKCRSLTFCDNDLSILGHGRKETISRISSWLFCFLKNSIKSSCWWRWQELLSCQLVGLLMIEAFTWWRCLYLIVYKGYGLGISCLKNWNTQNKNW